MALNFPSNPVNGQQYTGDNGIVYTYSNGRWVGAGALGNTVPSKVKNDGYELNLNIDGTVSFPNYTFPLGDGTNGQTLVTDGSGHLSWAAGGGGGSSRAGTGNQGGSGGGNYGQAGLSPYDGKTA